MTCPRYPLTVEDREKTRAAFRAVEDPVKTAYTRREYENDEPVYVLYDNKGYCLLASRHGQFDLINYAIRNDITILSVH